MTTFAMWLPPPRARYVWEYIIAQNSFTSSLPTYPEGLLEYPATCVSNETFMRIWRNWDVCRRKKFNLRKVYNYLPFIIFASALEGFAEFIQSCADSCNLYTTTIHITNDSVLGVGFDGGGGRLLVEWISVYSNGSKRVRSQLPARKENFALFGRVGVA